MAATEAMIVVADDWWCRQADRLAVEFSSALIGLAGDDVIPAIDGLLMRIGEALEVDRGTLTEFAEDGETFRAVHHWMSDTLSPLDVPRHVQRLLSLLDGGSGPPDPLVIERIPEDLTPDALHSGLLAHLREAPTRSMVLIPIAIAGERVCALTLETAHAARAWPEALIVRVRLLGEILTAALRRSRQEAALRSRYDSVVSTSRSPAAETAPVTTGRAARIVFDEIVGDSAALRAVLAQVEEVTPTDSTVLLLGETGTGKELIARALHAHGPRHAFPLVSVNCAALPAGLIESELFGHERGAFTGAISARPGRFQLAHRGTLFLDEIGDLPLELQSKLLRVLQEGEFERIGSSHTQKVNVRIVAATHRNLARAVTDGEFREDLYYRLSVFPIRLPPLRERREDIPAIVWAIIHKRQRTMRRRIETVSPEVMAALQRREWPGNVRELENVIERALIHSPGESLRLVDDPLERPVIRETDDGGTLSAVERTHIEGVLRDCRGRINGIGNAAERLGLHPNTLRFRMKKLGIVRSAAAR